MQLLPQINRELNLTIVLIPPHGNGTWYAASVIAFAVMDPG